MTPFYVDRLLNRLMLQEIMSMMHAIRAVRVMQNVETSPQCRCVKDIIRHCETVEGETLYMKSISPAVLGSATRVGKST